MKTPVFAVAAVCALSVLAGANAPSRAADINLTESGSTLLYPLVNVWVSEYVKTHSGVHITTSGGGSTMGIEQACSGAVQIGTSDAYMSEEQIRKNPQIINVALAISAVTVNYNLPGLNSAHVRLDGPTLAAIYAGKITAWDDKAISALNTGLTLPHQAIIPIRRSDGSGDTFVFTQYLTFSTPSWEDRIGYGTAVAWPAVPNGLTAAGNEGMLQTLRQTPYALAYLGVSYHTQLEQAALGTAALKSYDGEFLLPGSQTIAAAAAALTPRTPPDERLTLVNAPGKNAYPLVNYEYAIVARKQPNPAVAQAIRKFLLWAIAPDETNERYLSDSDFIPLPAHIWVLSHDQIESIT
jgi:phosphate transport system substrate-binding protein